MNSITVLGRQSLAELAAEAAELAAAAGAAEAAAGLGAVQGAPPSAATIGKSLLALAVLSLGVPIIPQVRGWAPGAPCRPPRADGPSSALHVRQHPRVHVCAQLQRPRVSPHKSCDYLLAVPRGPPPTPGAQDTVADLAGAHFVGVLMRLRSRLAPLLLPPRFDSPRDIRWHSAVDPLIEPIWDAGEWEGGRGLCGHGGSSRTHAVLQALHV